LIGRESHAARPWASRETTFDAARRAIEKGNAIGFVRDEHGVVGGRGMATASGKGKEQGGEVKALHRFASTTKSPKSRKPARGAGGVHFVYFAPSRARLVLADSQDRLRPIFANVRSDEARIEVRRHHASSRREAVHL
jgi:hypothetical protein